MRRFVWTIEEIQRLRTFGDDIGWFYGIVRDFDGVHFAEIYPGMGYVSAFPIWHPQSWWWAVRDIVRARSHYLGAAQ